MKIRFNKILSLCLCVMIAFLSVSSSFAYASDENKDIIDSGTCGLYGDNLKWFFYSDGELVISGNGEMDWYYVDHNNGGIETSMSAPWSKYYNNIGVITIKEGVTSIGNDAFVGKNIQYHRINIPESIDYFECLETFGGNFFDTIKTYQPNGKHIAFCYAGTPIDWDAVEFKHYGVAFNEASKRYEKTYIGSSIGNHIEHTGFRDYCSMYFDGEKPADFCEIQRTTSTVTINPFEKVELYAHYFINTDNNANLIWSIEGDGIFLNGEKDKTTTGTGAELLFLDDTTVKLKLISSNGSIISEDEIYLKSYRNQNMSFFEKIKYSFLMILIVVVGMLGGTVGHWIGTLII